MSCDKEGSLGHLKQEMPRSAGPYLPVWAFIMHTKSDLDIRHEKKNLLYLDILYAKG